MSQKLRVTNKGIVLIISITVCILFGLFPTAFIKIFYAIIGKLDQTMPDEKYELNTIYNDKFIITKKDVYEKVSFHKDYYEFKIYLNLAGKEDVFLFQITTSEEPIISYNYYDDNVRAYILKFAVTYDTTILFTEHDEGVFKFLSILDLEKQLGTYRSLTPMLKLILHDNYLGESLLIIKAFLKHQLIDKEIVELIKNYSEGNFLESQKLSYTKYDLSYFQKRYEELYREIVFNKMELAK